MQRGAGKSKEAWAARSKVQICALTAGPSRAADDLGGAPSPHVTEKPMRKLFRVDTAFYLSLSLLWGPRRSPVRNQYPQGTGLRPIAR